ncbi:hypothetical protein DPMN_007404 [Dreissena polymorpha]|uniref:Uncharacterized protein n=1 Tax=Dreissena polymorpha TaxID=45954 RepID=A0A9D4MT77_DREPO|nr:hypothetical protein DPMN_007404 [Dreissena polymorpha]
MDTSSKRTARQSQTAVNDSLLKIKEKSASQADCCDDDYDDYEMFPPRQQQFCQDLDNQLCGLSSELYISRLIKLCSNDYSKLNDYRERLAERAKNLPDCPQGRLINRKNSSTGSREHKNAIDCYTLDAFINGARNKDIHEIFSQTNERLVIDDANGSKVCTCNTEQSDLQSSMEIMKGAILQMAKEHAHHPTVLHQLQSDISNVLTAFRVFNGT